MENLKKSLIVMEINVNLTLCMSDAILPPTKAVVIFFTLNIQLEVRGKKSICSLPFEYCAHQ